MIPQSPSESPPLTVTELTRQIKQLLESNFPVVRLRGEISNLRRQQSGHVYFSLKDRDAAIAGVCFRADAERLKVRLRDGLQIVGTGRVAVYEPRGSYQVIFRIIEEDGIGRLQQAFLELKEKLSAEGLFDPARKRSLPRLPATVGFVTSDSGAALRDFISILRRRSWGGDLVVIPARVQGAGAAEEIVNGIELANLHNLCDLLVIGRGGGSIEDLWPFNEEIVARAVAASTIPIISAVGHEIDFTLSDFAADHRAETPSAAAEWITSARQAYVDRHDALSQRLLKSTDRLLERIGHRLSIATVNLRHQHPQNRLEQAHLRMDDLQGRLGQFLQYSFQQKGRRLDVLRSKFDTLRPEQQLRSHQEKLRQIAIRLVNNSHQATLKRGYAIVRNIRNELVSDASAIGPNSDFLLEMRDGQLRAKRSGGS